MGIEKNYFHSECFEFAMMVSGCHSNLLGIVGKLDDKELLDVRHQSGLDGWIQSFQTG